jgi:hypothetical protein
MSVFPWPNMRAVAEILSMLVLLVLPGAWIAFGFPLRRFSFAARLALAGVLSPPLIGIEFYLPRALHFSFSATVQILLLLSFGSIWFVLRAWSGTRVSWISLSPLLGVYLLFLTFLAPYTWLSSPQSRIFSLQSWMHMGIIYQFPDGALLPEEPELAGLHLVYPWLGHVYWSVLGWSSDLPPTKLYLATNLLCLFWVCVLFYETCRGLGASRFAANVGLIWLGLGTNLGGSLIWVVAKLLGWQIALPGDYRTTPWVQKFISLQLMPFALGLFAALALVGLELLRSRDRDVLAVFAIVLASIGLIYPQLFLPAVGFSGILLLFVWREERSQPPKLREHIAPTLLVGILVAGIIAVAYEHLLVESRSIPVLSLTSPPSVIIKLATGLLAMGVFLAPAFMLPRRKLMERKNLLLLAGGLTCLLLRSFWTMGAGTNEHKFLFCGALLLAPLACLALDRWVPERISPVPVVLASILLIIPNIFVIRGQYHKLELFGSLPKMDEGRFFIRLNPTESNASWVEAIDSDTPRDTVVLLEHSNLFLPAILRRSLLAPPDHSEPVPGYWFESRYQLIQERGYSAKVLDTRRALLHCLFECTDSLSLQEVENELRSLRRPVAIVFMSGEGKSFLDLLRQRGEGHAVYQGDDGTIVWLIPVPG